MRHSGWRSRSRTTAGELAPHTNGGHGLVGIRERVALYGGSVDLAPAPTGGVRLAVSLPLKEVP
jgi:signal transduction histidine kinase